MNIKNNPYYWSHILRLFVTVFTVPSFSVRKYVYFVHTILTVYLTILYTFIASAQGGAALAPRPPQSTHGLRPPCITSFVSLSCISLCTLYIPLYPTKYIHLLQEIQINAPISFPLLFSSIILSITNLIILGCFSLLHSFFKSSASMMNHHFIHLLIVHNQIHTTSFIDLIVLDFPEGTSSSYQPLIFYSYASLSSTTIFSCDDSGIHHLFSFTQCLFENGVSSTYSVTIRM